MSTDSDRVNNAARSGSDHGEDFDRIVIPDTDTLCRDFGSVKLRGAAKDKDKLNMKNIIPTKIKNTTNSNIIHDDDHIIRVPHTDHLYRDFDSASLSGYSSKNSGSDSSLLINKKCVSNTLLNELVEENEESDINNIVVPHTDHMFRDLKNTTVTPDIVNINISRNASDRSNVSTGIASLSSGEPYEDDEDSNCIRLSHSDHMDADVTPRKGRHSARSSASTSSNSKIRSHPTSDASINSDTIVLPRSDGKRHSLKPDTVLIPHALVYAESDINSTVLVEEGNGDDHDRIVIPHTDTVYHDLGKEVSRPNTTSPGFLNTSTKTSTSSLTVSEPVDDGRISLTHSDNNTLEFDKGGNLALNDAVLQSHVSTRKSFGANPNQVQVGRSDDKKKYSIWNAFNKK